MYYINGFMTQLCMCIIYIVTYNMYCYSSAGVGRTGTLICVRSMIQMIEDKTEVDIFNYALKMRKKRSYMIQSEVRGFHIRSCIVTSSYSI